VEATTVGDDSDVKNSLTEFTRVYNVLEQNYADVVDPDRAIYGVLPDQQLSENFVGAIPGALRSLDPHSNFYDPVAFSKMREEQEGKYYGVGMQIGQRPGKLGKLVVVVMFPIPGSPAFRAGLRPADVIAKVNGQSTEGMNTLQVAEKLKGPKGTHVHITVIREGYDQPLEFDITRDEISQRSVDDVFMIKPGIGYIHINRFNENTNDELSEALKSLGEKTLQGLVLDLRWNPGGLLQEAVDVSDHFLEKSQLIVYHYGRHSQEKRYYTTKGDGGKEYPIVVLINRMTASAAEIVTGALQDHDRALVMGQPSFGKGLVQTVFPLSEHTGLALTTARYYTPSGRLIQRDYDNVSLYDYYYRPEDSPTPHTDVRLTDGGREVYGGGGITPDIKYEEPKLTPAQDMLTQPQHNTFFEFGKYYLGIHKTIPRDFEVTDAVFQEFRQFLAEQKIQISDQDLKDNSDFIRTRIRLQLIDFIFGGTEAHQFSMEIDPLVQKAIESMPQASALLAKAKRYIASKSQR
jgi:carboxyl-terminal processing protease